MAFGDQRSSPCYVYLSSTYMHPSFLRLDTFAFGDKLCVLGIGARSKGGGPLHGQYSLGFETGEPVHQPT